MSGTDGHPVSPQWTAWREAIDLDGYDARFAGSDAHGEADRIMSFAPATVLDAGCGTGRVAIELHRRGCKVVGVDLDDEMLDRARRRCPAVTWVYADLATFDLAGTFDVVAMPGNVMRFCRSEDRAAVVQRCAAHVRVGGVMITGFGVVGGLADPTLRVYDDACRESGMVLADRHGTWDAQPYDGGDFVVSVHLRRV